MPNRVLETTLTGRNLLSPMLAKASADVVAFNSTIARANTQAGTVASASAQVQDRAADKIAASNVKASTSASASAQQQMRAHAKAAESATLSARLQETANRSLAASNGLLGTSLTPITAGLGATALALGYAAYSGMTFDKSMSRVQAASQASGAELRRLRQAALDAGADTQYSAEEAAQGITELSKAGVSVADVLGGGLKGALNLAAAGEMDVADAAEVGATALSVFNLRGNQMSHVADLLAAGAGKAQGSVGDMSQALNQSALVANQMNLSIEDTTGALAMFAHNGLLGSDAGTSFKSMLQRLNPQSKEAAALMDQLGLRAYDQQGKFVGLAGYADQLRGALSGMSEEQRNATLTTLFGSDAVRAAAILYKEGAKGVEQWAGKVDDAGFAARQAADNNNNLAGDLEKLAGAAKTAFTAMGQGAQGPLREAVQALTAVVNAGGDVIEFFTNLPGPIQAGLVALTAVHVLGGPVTTTIKGIGFAVDVMGASFKNAGGAAGVLKGGASGLLGVFGGPWGLAITGAAVGLSLLVSWLGKADDATEGATDAQRNLTSALEASKGAIDANVKAAAAKAAQDEGILDAMEAAGLSTEHVTDAILRQGNSYNDVMAGLIGYRDAHTSMTGEQTKEANAIRLAIDALQGLAGQTEGTVADAQQIARATGEVGTAMQGAAVLTEEAAKAQEDWLKTVSAALQGFVDPLQAYEGLLDEKTQAEQEQAQATADATKSSKDSWKDYVEDVDVSLGELADRLEEQLTEQANWRTNIAKIAQWAGADVANYLTEMGKDGVDIVAKMADGTTADAKRMATDITKTIQAGGNDWAAGMDNATKVMAAIGASGGKATRAALSKELGISVTEVQQIANQYGVVLATGINPVLSAIGKKAITINQKAGRTYVGMNAYAEGGYTGDGDKWEPKGVVHGGEYVVTKERTARLGVKRLENLEKILPVYAGGGFVSPDAVPHPPSTAPYRAPISTAADGVMGKEYADVTAWLKANQEPAYTGGGTASASSAELVKFGRWLQSQGARVSEHPAFGGVTMGAHVPGSKHYSGRAIDVNTRAGTSALEQRELDPLMAAARAAGFQTIFMSEGHFNHGHVAARKSGGPVWPGQDFLVGEEGPELVRMTGTGTVIPAGRTAAMVAPAAMPGYGMGGGYATAPARPVVVSLARATVTGRFEFGSDGLVRLVDGRIDGALNEIHDTIHYAGG